MNIPIAHIHGGERTEGAIDEYFRHAMTKLSNYHFVAAEEYRKRVIQMGENPHKVYNVGALGLDNLKKIPYHNINELGSLVDENLNGPYFIVTYHPVTLNENAYDDSILEIFKALEYFNDYQVIITFPNFDAGNKKIIEEINNQQKKSEGRFIVKKSLGHKLYHTLVKSASLVIGNSSSGIIEVPAHNVPTVNIGDRQKGRLHAASIITCKNNYLEIKQAIEYALNPEFMTQAAQSEKPYGEGNAAQKIMQILEKIEFTSIKQFYDVEYQ